MQLLCIGEAEAALITKAMQHSWSYPGFLWALGLTLAWAHGTVSPPLLPPHSPAPSSSPPPPAVPPPLLPSALRDVIFAGYDAEQYPQGPSGGGGGVMVTVSLNLVQIEEVDILHGVLELHAWVRMAWEDLRLSWAGNGRFDAIDFLRVPAALPAPDSRRAVWVPDIELLNGATSLSTPLRSYDATLYRNGTLFWSRLAKLRVLCAFNGLQRFPAEDDMVCHLQFGSPALSESYEDLQWGNASNHPLFSGEQQPVTTEGTLASDFLEFEVVHSSRDHALRATRIARTYTFDPGATFPTLHLELPVKRHVKFYSLKITALTMILTYLTFGVFFAHPKSINRQHFSATLLLCVISIDIYVEQMIPKVSRLVWMELFMYTSILFVALVSVQNFLVLYLWWHADPTVLSLGMSATGRAFHRVFKCIRSLLERPARICAALRKTAGEGVGDPEEGHASAMRPKPQDSEDGEGSSFSSSKKDDDGYTSKGKHQRHGHGDTSGDAPSDTGSSATNTPQAARRRLGWCSKSAAIHSKMAPHSEPDLESGDGSQHSGSAASASAVEYVQIKRATFQIIISGRESAGMVTNIGRRLLVRPLKQAIILPALSEYYRQHPNEPAVDLGYVHISVNESEINLDTRGQDPAASFVQGPDVPILVTITLPVMSLAAVRDLEAAAAAAQAAEKAVTQSAAANGGEAPTGALPVAAPEIVGPGSSFIAALRRRRRGSAELHSPVKANTLSEHGEDDRTSNAGSTDGRLNKRSSPPIRRRSFEFSAEDMPSFAALAGKSAALLAVRDSTKSLARLVTATKMDPVDAALVRKVFRMLDEEKRGFLGEDQIETWVNHFGGLPGNVLDACGVRDHKKWQVDEFKSICQHVIGEQGKDKFQAMLRGVEDSIQGRLAEHEMYWHALALKVDYESRWIFNVGYTACWFGLWMMRDTALFD